MQIAYPDARHLAPFILLALSLHAALLFFFHPPIQQHSPSRPMEVFLSTRSAPVTLTAAPASSKKHADIPSFPRTAWERHSSAPRQNGPPAQRVEARTQPAMPASAPVDALMESARSIAHDDARKFEQHELAQQKRNLNTPIGALTQALRQPQKEIRMANGMLKIITAAGAVCFQPPPLFARDQAGLYGIPRTCP